MENNIKNPAAVFSAEGLRIFIDAIRGANISGGNHTGNINGDSSDDGNYGDSEEVNILVNEYFSSKPVRKNNIEAVADLVEECLKFESKTAVEIREFLEIAHFHYKPKAMANLMAGVMKRKPNIKKIGRGLYGVEGAANNEE